MAGTYITLRIKKDALITECRDLLESLKKHPVVSYTKLDVKLKKTKTPLKKRAEFIYNENTLVH